MPTTTQIDPLAAHRAGCRTSAGKPIPLAATRIAVTLEGGLAVVAFKRMFRNVETSSIEATMTFPVPTDAVMTGLTARIGDRLLTGSAQARSKARTAYEDAIDAGKSAVLHEEVLKGVHVLTVGHVPAGAEIDVESRWVQPLSFLADAPSLRIPVTVGDIYGRSPLKEVDDLLVEGVRHDATIEIQCGTATAHLQGGALENGRADLQLDRPIDIVFTGWVQGPAAGNLRDRRVAVSVSPAPVQERPLNATIVMDASGSMNEVERSDTGGVSKHEAARTGLLAAARSLTGGDRIALWEFATRFQYLGTSDAAGAEALVARLGAPNGGTEIGRVLAEVVARDPDADILLLTDGRSHALDVSGLALGKHRITTVLIGESALDANVGHLTAMTGGQILVASAADVAPAIARAVATMRAPRLRPGVLQDIPGTLSTQRSGARIEASLSEGGNGTDDVGAYFAGLVLPSLPEERGAALAMEAGIVTHLTSLVLVDEAGTRQEGLPSMRKVPLSRPAALRQLSAAPAMALASMDASSFASKGLLRSRDAGSPAFRGMPRARPGIPSMPPVGDVSAFEAMATGGIEVSWSQDPESLRRGDMAGRPHRLQAFVQALAGEGKVQALASALSLSPVVTALALLASISDDRYAARFLRAVVAADAIDRVKRLADELMLSQRVA